jgi:SAM-dependent methyltransferase
MLANLGVTKHVGSQAATQSIIDQSGLSAGAHVLDVGCGIGLTAFYLVERYGCAVTAVDITPAMIDRAREEARLRQVSEDRLHFAVADAQDLPFADETFDLVMVESVNVFLADRARAFDAYARVTVHGGHVGITESTWLEPPGEDATAFMDSIGGDVLLREDWTTLMRGAGLDDVTSQARPVDVREEARGRMARFGCSGMLRILWRSVRVLLKDSSSRRTIQRATQTVPREIMKHMGYGVYVGRKP